MREPISVDPDVFDAASTVFGRDIHGQLSKARNVLESELSGDGGMAGSDPAGTAWASSYDEAAQTVRSLIGDVGTASTALAALLQQTGFNHGMAESQSDPTRSVPTPPDDTVYRAGSTNVPALPSAHGGSGSPPASWWLVEHTVGYVWPNGDPGKLGAAAHAWSSAADAVAAAGYFVPEALGAVASQQSPEVDAAFTVCNSMNDHINDVASACRDLSRACTDFANGIDKAHTDVGNELTSLAEWTAGIEAGGFVLGVLTAGGAELPAQGVEATRIAATAARIGKIIQTLIDLAATISRSVVDIFTKVAEAAARIRVILGARLSKAVTALVARLPSSAGDAADTALREMSSWSKDWPQRGLELEDKLGGNLPPGFPTIDKFQNGIVTSIKSVDLTAPSYQDAGRLASRIRGYVDKVAKFQGDAWDGTRITAPEIKERALEVAIQPGVASSAQWATLNQLKQYATSKGIQLIVQEVE